MQRSSVSVDSDHAHANKELLLSARQQVGSSLRSLAD
jgi:hypothetical protein